MSILNSNLDKLIDFLDNNASITHAEAANRDDNPVDALSRTAVSFCLLGAIKKVFKSNEAGKLQVLAAIRRQIKSNNIAKWYTKNCSGYVTCNMLENCKEEDIAVKKDK